MTLLSHANVGSAQTCASTQASWPNYSGWYGSSDVIYVYIKSDFASDMRGCSSDTDDDTELTQTKAEMAIQSAMEMWNQGSLGTALVYGGQTSASFATVCSSGSYEKPAVYVEFVAGCQDIEAPAGCDGDNAVASVFDDAGCSNVVHLQVYGANDSGSPSSCSTGEILWDLGDTVFTGGTNDFKSVLIHEFGHVLNLGHPTTDAIMKSGMGNYVSNRHLYGWDQDCADDNSSGRNIGHVLRGRDTSSSWGSITSIGGTGEERGNYSGGFLSNGGTAERYLL